MSNIIYALPIGNEDRKGNETEIYRNPFMKDKKPEDIFKLKTIHDVYNKMLKNPKKDLFGYRKQLKKQEGDKEDNFENKYSWLNVQEVFEKSQDLGSGLINLNLIENINEWNNYELKFIGIYSKNSLNYFLTDIGCCIYNITTIPIYDTLGEEATQFAFDQTKMKSCFLTANHVEKVFLAKKDKNMFQYLKNLIILDSHNLKTELKEKYKGVLNIYTFEEIIEEGKKKRQEWAEVTPESIYSFSYTSGTTGTPKGAMISHKNICATIDSIKVIFKFLPVDIYISYLPLAHVMEKVFYNNALFYGVRIGVYSGNNLRLVEDMSLLKPTIFASVPRLFNKMYDKIKKGINSKNNCLKKILNYATNVKLENLKKTGNTKHWLYDLLFFNKMRNILGGNVRMMVTGSAPISTEVIDFLKVAFCVPILEGYGQTEALAIEFSTSTKDGLSGHVGGPVIHNEYKLIDVPDMGYTNRDKDENGLSKPRGEICVRGINVIPGYYKLDEKNKETFSKDGWMFSGDIGEIIPGSNALRIIDRKKNMFKLAQGEYIAPEKLENFYKNAHPMIADIFVYGDSLKSCLVAVVNVDVKDVSKLKESLGVDKDVTLDSKDFINNFLNTFLKCNKENKLNSLEKIKGLIVDTRDWQNLGLITNSFKKKRNELKKFYQEQINKLYEKLY